MGFSDLLSSGRGPGVIGTLIALLVLGGFGALFFVFDKDMEKAGGKKIEAVVRDLGLELDGKKTQKASFEKLIAEAEPLKGQDSKIRELTSATQTNATQIEELKAKIAEGSAAIDAETKDWEDYKVAYRSHVWKQAEGQEIREIKGIASGKVYPKGTIRSVDHTGIRTIDSTGIKTIPLDDIPDDLQDQYQLTKQGADEINVATTKAATEHFESTELSQMNEQLVFAKQKLAQLDAKAKELDGKVRTGKENQGKFHTAINRKKGEVRSEKSKSGGISRAPQMEAELRQLQNQEQANEAAISTNQRAAQDARAEANKLRDTIREQEEAFIKRRKEIIEKKAAEEAAAGAAAPAAAQ
ncbi:hypothetical protein [Luteolibacter luteus]|uniref:Uncharacterized protein n=1 Tax=Luteolibacter luteus TaxID=2728835 RepID=A0A858RL99_9BACT|nr:hypothetical protein [Luteolibacter luteus]QJE97238.1 hypothetical protein HHL09_16060 [Luteolibacter luteus]